eukprot:1140193-Pelagomonas_calceolata.AAC.2
MAEITTFCNDILLFKDPESLKITQFGAVGGQIWSFGDAVLRKAHEKPYVLQVCMRTPDTQLGATYARSIETITQFRSKLPPSERFSSIVISIVIRKERKLRRRRNSSYINEGKGDTLAQKSRESPPLSV